MGKLGILKTPNIVFCSTLLLILCSCSSGKKDAWIPWKDRKPVPHKFAPIKDHKLQLSLTNSRRVYHPGEDVTFTYRLVNRGSKTVKIYEWNEDSDANLMIYYHPYDPDLKTFKPEEWTCVKTELKKEPFRFQLELNPGNSVLTKQKLDFISKLPPDAPSQKFLVRGILNLKSLPLKSQTAIITIK